MKSIVFTAVLLLLANFAISQQHPGVSYQLQRDGVRPGDAFSNLPQCGKYAPSLGGRNRNHTQLDSAKYWTWYDTLGAWSLESQTNYSYSANSQMLLKLNGNLENQSLETWQFDDNGNILEFIFQIWDGSAWLNFFRFNYVYDGDNLVEFIYQSYAGGSYQNVLRYEYTYDGNGDLAEQLTQNWLGGVWIASSKRTSTYNGNHQPILVIQEQWLNEWINQYRETYTYGSSDELLTYLDEAWESDWEIIEQTTYTYDGQLRLVEEYGQLFEGGILIWETKDIYTYDIHDNVTSIITQNTESGELADRGRQLLEYDDENNQINYVFQYLDDGWVSYDSALFYWNPVTSLTDASTMEDDLVVFPNPASHELQFDVANHNGSTLSYSIVSINGVQRKAGYADAEGTIDISGLPQGMHVLNLTSRDGKQYLKRFLKQ
jgi:hypothetical protein